MPWGRGGPWAGAGAWVDGQGRVAMARTTGRCGRPARLVAAICSVCGRRLGESPGPWVAEGPICPLGGGRGVARLSEAHQALEAWDEVRALELSQLEGTDRTWGQNQARRDPHGTLFDPLRPRVPQMCCPKEENLRRFYRGLKAFSPPSPHTGLLPGLNSTVSDKETQSG